MLHRIAWRVVCAIAAGLSPPPTAGAAASAPGEADGAGPSTRDRFAAVIAEAGPTDPALTDLLSAERAGGRETRELLFRLLAGDDPRRSLAAARMIDAVRDDPRFDPTALLLEAVEDGALNLGPAVAVLKPSAPRLRARLPKLFADVAPAVRLAAYDVACAGGVEVMAGREAVAPLAEAGVTTPFRGRAMALLGKAPGRAAVEDGAAGDPRGADAMAGGPVARPGLSATADLWEAMGEKDPSDLRWLLPSWWLIPDARSEILDLLASGGVNRAGGPSLLLAALADENAEVRAAGQRVADRLLAESGREPALARLLADVAFGRDKLTISQALELLERLDPACREPAAIELAILAAVFDDKEYADRLARWGSKDAPFAAMARALTPVIKNAQVSWEERTAVRDAVRDFLRDPTRYDLLVELLCDERPFVRSSGAEAVRAGRGMVDAGRLLLTAAMAGRRIEPAVVAATGADPERVWVQAAALLRHPDPDVRVAALALVAVGPGAAAEMPAEVRRLLRDRDARVRINAAAAVGTPEARALVMVAEVLVDLRAESPTLRRNAARRLESLGVYPPTVTAALIKATDAGDFLARQGLVSALEQAFYDDSEVVKALRAAAEQTADAPARTCAKSALRELAAAGP